MTLDATRSKKLASAAYSTYRKNRVPTYSVKKEGLSMVEFVEV
jgi:hypothetical protein